MIDFDKFKYRVGDKIRKIGYTAEYEIVEVNNDRHWEIDFFYYRIKNLSEGCLDNAEWLPQGIVHTKYEPCNPMVKVLFGKLIVTTSSRTTNSANLTTPHRVEEGLPDDHSLDALSYIIPTLKKVSR